MAFGRFSQDPVVCRVDRGRRNKDRVTGYLGIVPADFKRKVSRAHKYDRYADTIGTPMFKLERLYRQALSSIRVAAERSFGKEMLLGRSRTREACLRVCDVLHKPDFKDNGQKGE